MEVEVEVELVDEGAAAIALLDEDDNVELARDACEAWSWSPCDDMFAARRKYTPTSEPIASCQCYHQVDQQIHRRASNFESRGRSQESLLPPICLVDSR